LLKTPRSCSENFGAKDMADIPTKAEIGVTTGAIRGSKKIHVAAQTGSGVRVAMREIQLEPSSGEPPVRVYDTSGPYTDDNALIDIKQGLAELIMVSLAPIAAAALRHSPMSAPRCYAPSRA
jgi:ThiC-associated domain